MMYASHMYCQDCDAQFVLDIPLNDAKPHMPDNATLSKCLVKVVSRRQ